MKIITAVVNNPIFIEIQYHTLKKHVKGHFAFMVFNDAKGFPDFTNGGNSSIKYDIENTCKKLNLKHIEIPNEEHRTLQDPALRCADSMNYILNYQINNPDKYLFIDSDMFLINDFETNTYEKYECSIVKQRRSIKKRQFPWIKKTEKTIDYFWNGLHYFDIENMSNLNELNWDIKKYCDVGGMMQNWLTNQTARHSSYCNTNHNAHNIKIPIYYIHHLSSCQWGMNNLPTNLKHNESLINFLTNDPRNLNNNFFCEIYDNRFFHYRAGGNWRKESMEVHEELSKKLKNIFLRN
jgi:hypothetical protein